ncbi:RNA-directed DNA polymerase, eukaryota [Tanacetum coccineum]
MRDDNWKSYRSKEDQIQSISQSIFVTNFPDHVTARDLWKVCKDYGVVVDAFIPYKKSKTKCKPSAPSHPTNANERNLPSSYVSILKWGKMNNAISYQVLPSLILDDSCISNRDFSFSLLGKVKDITDMPILYVILENEGFQNLPLTYLGGLWVLIETVSISAEEKLLNHTGDKVTPDNDVQKVSESSCMHNNDLLYDNNHNNIMPDKDKVLSEDPFNLYDILNTRNDSDDDLKYPPGFTPSGINIEEAKKKVKGATSNEVNEHVNYTSKKLEESVPKGKLSSNNSFCSKRVHTGGSILQLMDELVKFFIRKLIGWVPSSSKLLIISVYAPQDVTEKRVLRDYILHLIDRWDGDCVIMGDFNKVRTKQERYGSGFNVQGADAFNSFISLTSLVNLPLDGYAYTWAHKTANKMRKLDRYLVSKGLLALFSYLSALCLDRNLSDHRPILMWELSIDYGPNPFRFFHSWFNLDGFDKMVEDTWKSLATVDSNDMLNLKKKL